MKIICPKCREQGLKSIVEPGMRTTTLMVIHEWYDEEGDYHVEDPNTTSTSYSCSNGHQWSETR